VIKSWGSIQYLSLFWVIHVFFILTITVITTYTNN